MEVNLDWRRQESAQWPEVGYEIRPLRVWAFQELMAFWEGPEGDPETPTLRISPMRSFELLHVAKRIFPDHVRNLTGLTLLRDGATVPATPEALCEEAPLLPLAGEIISRLVAISEIGAAAEKN